MHFFEEIKKWLAEITEISLLLIALGVVVEILFGQAVPLFGGIVTNLTGLLSTLGENGLAGLVAAGVILFLFNRQKPRLVGAVRAPAPAPASRGGGSREPTDTQPKRHLASIGPAGDKPTVPNTGGRRPDRAESRSSCCGAQTAQKSARGAVTPKQSGLTQPVEQQPHGDTQ